MSRYKNWAHKISYWEYLTIWKSALPVFPWAQSTSFPLSTLNSFRECWKSEAAAAHDLILVEVDGKQSWQVPICGWQYACMCTKLLPLCLTLCDTMDCSPPSSSVHGDSPGKNTGMSRHALLQGIFATQGSKPGLLHCRLILYCLSHQGSPWILEWVAYSFSRGSSQPRDRTQVSLIAGWFFTVWAFREA